MKKIYKNSYDRENNISSNFTKVILFAVTSRLDNLINKFILEIERNK